MWFCIDSLERGNVFMNKVSFEEHQWELNIIYIYIYPFLRSHVLTTKSFV